MVANSGAVRVLVLPTVRLVLSLALPIFPDGSWANIARVRAGFIFTRTGNFIVVRNAEISVAARVTTTRANRASARILTIPADIVALVACAAIFGTGRHTATVQPRTMEAARRRSR